MHREVAVRLPRSVERGERGAIAAAELLMTTADGGKATWGPPAHTALRRLIAAAHR